MAILSIKAGRCKRRGETNWVDPQPAKGRIEIQEADGLLTFCEYGSHRFARSRPTSAGGIVTDLSYAVSRRLEEQRRRKHG
jgi:hypothetical protein